MPQTLPTTTFAGVAIGLLKISSLEGTNLWLSRPPSARNFNHTPAFYDQSLPLFHANFCIICLFRTVTSFVSPSTENQGIPGLIACMNFTENERKEQMSTFFKDYLCRDNLLKAMMVLAKKFAIKMQKMYQDYLEVCLLFCGKGTVNRLLCIFCHRDIEILCFSKKSELTKVLPASVFRMYL